ncbi:hypothetical protein NESM_000379100 [Novymonas esmeraldas]|uniref:Uncharacterized protein n=1 Tax=Novymonas esmeraldas TaxID=1808958 RepID=A0AAW0EN35_9TRYP
MSTTAAMRSVLPSTGVGPTSASHHADSRHRHSQPPPQEQPFPSDRRRPVSSMPAGGRRPVGGGGGGGGASADGSRPRPASAAPFSSDASREVAYLSQQLQDALQQQSQLEEQRQRQLVQYRRRLRAFCDDNAALRNIIAAGESRRRDAEAAAAAAGTTSLTGSRAHTTGTVHGPATVTEAEVEVLLHRTTLARQRHNKTLHEIHVNEAALDAEARAQDALVEQSQSTMDPATMMLGANRPVYLRMMRLEQSLNDVLRKQRTVSVVLSNYRHHLGILAAEATQYDAQQALLEKEFADRHRDHLQLLQLHDTARAAYATAVDARQAVQQSATRMRKVKERALQQKRREVDRSLAAAQQQERRAVDLQQQLEEEVQLLEAAENVKAQLERQRMNSRAALTLLQNTSVTQDDSGGAAAGGHSGRGADPAATGVDERVAAYEVAFRDMMRVARVSTPDELVAAYHDEIARQCRLQDELDYMREVQAGLQEEVQLLRERAKQTKYCVGAGTRWVADVTAAAEDADVAAAAVRGTAASPLLERELHTFVGEERRALATHVRANEESQLLLMEVAGRVNALAELVADYRADVRVPALQRSPALAQRSSTLPLHVAVLAQKLLALAADASSVTAGTDAAAVAVVSSTPLMIPAHNRRVSLAHGGGGGVAGGGGPRHGGARGRAAAAADVAGMSSSAARALLYANGGGGGGTAAAVPSRRRRSSATAGAGFIEGQEDDDDVPLTTVAALPPAGGRVLDADVASTDSSEQRSGSVDAEDADGGGGGDLAGSQDAAAAAAMVASATAKQSRAPPGGGPQHTGGSAAATRARAAGDDQEDPLLRSEVKRMSELVSTRQRREVEKGAARRPQ